jgi:MFS family permease
MYPGVILHIFALMMTSISKTIWQFMLTQGILGGLGMGIIIGPSLAATGQYFNKKRGAAMGLCVAGSSVGGVIFPISLSRMFANPRLGFGWSVRISGFLVTALLAVSCLTIKARLPPRKGKLFLAEAFKNVTYMVMIGSVFLMLLGMFTPFFYLPTYAIQRGMGVQLAFYLSSILNGASFFGRIIPGILGDKFGRLNLLFLSAVSSGILIFCFPRMASNAAIIVFAVLYGFSSGAIVSLMSAAFMSVPKDPKEMGTYYGMGMAIDSLAPLIGPPVNGALVTKYRGFNEASILSGTAVVLGGVCILAAKATTSAGVWSKN